MKQKYYVELNQQEWRFIIESLNRFTQQSQLVMPSSSTSSKYQKQSRCE